MPLCEKKRFLIKTTNYSDYVLGSRLENWIIDYDKGLPVKPMKFIMITNRSPIQGYAEILDK